MRVHPAADLFPMMSDAELAELAEDIKQNGQQHPIIVGFCYSATCFDPDSESVVDGRNRLRACEIAGAEPWIEKRCFTDDAEIVRYVVSVNIQRRHLTTSQRAMVAARLLPFLEAEAAERRRLGTSAEISAEVGRAVDIAGERLNVSGDSVGFAKRVVDGGAPELVAAVDSAAVKVSTAAVVASELTPDEQREVVARGEKEIIAKANEIRARKLEERRAARIVQLDAVSRQAAPLTGALGRFPILYADPPWRYDFNESESRAIENHYETMDLEEICALPVGDIATDDAVLFLWATSPMLRDAMRVLEAWGFAYKTSLVWAKPQLGMGYWVRVEHEIVIVATRGNPPLPPPSARPRSVITAPRTEHSAKPPEVAEAIERMYPELRKLELFCRTPRPGWTVWGNEVADAAE